MRRLPLMLAVAATAGIMATGAPAAILDGPLAARAAVNDVQAADQVALVCHHGWRWRYHRCHRVYGGYYGGPYGYGAPYYGYGGPYGWGGPAISFGFGFGGGHWGRHW